MSDQLPNGWRKAKLGEICREDRVAIGNSDPAYATMPYLGLEHIESNRGRILVTEDEARQSDSKSNNFRFTAEHVLYGKLRPYLNKVALPEFSGRCTTEIIPLLPVGTDRRWLAWLLRQEEVVEHAMRGKTGSRMPRTSMRDFMQLLVAVPPLDEQRRIVARLEEQLSTAERARSAALAQLAAVEAMPQALFRQIFPRSPARELLAGWRWAKLGEVCEIVNGSTPKSAVPEYWDGDICWVTPTDLGQLGKRSIERTARSITKAGYDSCSTTLVPAGAVVMSSRAPIGHLAIAATELCTNQGCKSFVPTSAVESEYLYHALHNSMDDIRALGVGATFAEVSKRTLAAFTIPLPLVDEQRRIVREIDEQTAAIERARIAAQAQLDSLDALPAAVLRLAFAP